MGDGWGKLFGRGWPAPPEQRFRMDEPDAAQAVGQAVSALARPLARSVDSLLLVCIGTDRSIGDALGPLVGSLIADAGAERGFRLLGCLDNPVHAANLVETMERVEREFPRALVVAVDACLGRQESVGTITVGRGPLKPGAGVNKSLPPVGELYVTGVVNVGGFMEYFVLQNTRLNLVMGMAKVIARGVNAGLSALADEFGLHAVTAGTAD